jgi:hypothetical protein
MYNLDMCDNTAVKCELCIELRGAEAGILDIVLAMRKIQKMLAPVMKRYEEIHRAHPRCALCTIMVGEDHHEIELIPEPMVPRAKGQKRYSVCPQCHKVLSRVKRSVPQQIKYQRHVEEELVRLEDSEDREYDGFWETFRKENPTDMSDYMGLEMAIAAIGESDETEDSGEGEEDAGR